MSEVGYMAHRQKLLHTPALDGLWWIVIVFHFLVCCRLYFIKCKVFFYERFVVRFTTSS